MSRFVARDLPIAGLKQVVRKRIGDDRGYFSRMFCADELAAMGWPWPVAQINESYSAHVGTVRGMHYQQPPYAEAKLVSCLRGRVMDVVVDLRAGSPTLLQWCSQELSLDNHTALLIPPGCAHGFQTLTDDVELLYVHSGRYVPAADAGVHPLDERVGVRWPLPISMMSEKDKKLPMLPIDFKGLQV